MIDAHKLDAFGSVTRPLFAALRGEGHPLPSAVHLSSVCTALQTEFTSARNAGVYANPWTIAGIGRRETRNCAVLASLWDPVIVGDIGRRFLTESLSIADPIQNHGFPINDIGQRPYSITCESCLAGEIANRMDIVIQSLGGASGWTIVIEAKIEASLGKNQIDRYSSDLAERKSLTGRETHLVLLSPTSPATLNERIAHLTWKGIASAARKAISDRPPLTATENLVSYFADHIIDRKF